MQRVKLAEGRPWDSGFGYGKIRDTGKMETNPDRNNVTLGISFWSLAADFRLWLIGERVHLQVCMCTYLSGTVGRFPLGRRLIATLECQEGYSCFFSTLPRSGTSTKC